MTKISRREALALLLAAPAAARILAQEAGNWIPLFDGTTLKGWKAGEHARSFRAADGQIVAHGERAHLFYGGPAGGGDFRNFELSLEAMTRPGTTSGVYFHTAYQPQGLPERGLKVQLANTPRETNGYLEQQKTGSLVPFRNVYKPLARDNEWVRLNILVRGKRVQVRVNDALVVDYLEPGQPFEPDAKHHRAIGHGTFALEARGDGGTAFFREIRIRPLPDSAPPAPGEQPEVDENYREIIRLGAENFPLVDYHVHLKGGLTIDQALANSRRLGIFYGVAINCGLGFPVHSDESVREYLNSMKGQPCYVAMQGEGREWRTLASRESIALFDYVFTDAMTFTDDSGKRMRIWLDDEIGKIQDSQAFMEMYVKRIVGVMHEPIDIYANSTFLPHQIAAGYDQLWTPERMAKVIDAAVKNNVAIEINNRYRIPSAAFIRAAKSAGASFSLGTNNNLADLGRLEYPIKMVRECGLRWQDIFVPRPEGQKAIQVKA